MPKDKAEWSEALNRAMAYAAAKQFRPALGRPQDFRPERLQPVVESLISILDQKPKADQALLAEMVDDASAGALQLAFAGAVGRFLGAIDRHAIEVGHEDGLVGLVFVAREPIAAARAWLDEA